MVKKSFAFHCLLFIFAGASAAQTRDDLVKLIAEPAVSGYERTLLEKIRTLAPNWAESRYDNMGNLIFTMGKGSPLRLVVAPVDEFGYVVSEIRNDGFIRVQFVQSMPPSPLFHQFHEGQPIFIITEKGRVPGVAATLSTHLQRNRTDNNFTRICQPDDMWIDIGARSKEEAERAGVRLLDAVSLRERAAKLGEHQAAGTAAGVRAATMALLQVLLNASPDKIEGSLTIAFVAQDSFGRRGADRLARSIKSDEAIVITDAWIGSLAIGQTVERDALGKVGKLGAGPVVAADDMYWNNIQPLQRVPSLRARSALYTGGPAFDAAKVHLIALPVMFGGTTAEIVDWRDAKQLAAIISSKIGKQPSSPAPAAKTLFPPAASVSSGVTGSAAILASLVETYGVSGYEEPVAEAVKKMLPAWAKSTTDERGNVIVSAGQGKPHLVFAAHMDEIGYVISAINEDGTTSIQKRGGFYDTLFEAHPMLVHSSGGEVPCIVSPRKDYAKADRRGVQFQELFLYFGTTTKAETEALGIKPGDSVTMPKRFEALREGRASGRSFDDRVGSAALVIAAQKLDPAKLKHRVTFVWTVEEETGLEGAKAVANKMQSDVDLVFAVDTFVSSDSPLETTRFANAPIGKGAVVRAMDNSNILPRNVLNKILKLAQEKGIPIQYGVTGGGNDGAVFTQYGAIDAPISWPLRYSHSPAELIDLRDLDALADLVRAIAESFEP